jgi:hypothetical protein
MKTNWKRVWEKVIHILAGIALGYILFGCKSSKDGCDAYSLKWTKDADSLIVYKNDEIFLPKTPANGAKQIYFNNTDKGKYVINLLKDGEVVETKKLNINR